MIEMIEFEELEHLGSRMISNQWWTFKKIIAQNFLTIAVWKFANH